MSQIEVVQFKLLGTEEHKRFCIRMNFCRKQVLNNVPRTLT